MKLFHTALAVNSLNETIKFYEEVFGFKIKTKGERPEIGVKFVMVENEEGNILEFFEHKEPQELKEDLMDLSKVGIKHIAFVVDNIEEVMEKALSAGAKVVWDIKRGVTVKRIAFIADINNIPIELVELN